MKSVQPMDPKGSLEEVRRQFIRWRADRTRRGQTPQKLRRGAVGLLEHHCAFHVCRALGINASALKSWATLDINPEHTSDKPARTSRFVTLPAEPSTVLGNEPVSNSALTIELPGRIRVHCDSVPRTVELLEALRARGPLGCAS